MRIFQGISLHHIQQAWKQLKCVKIPCVANVRTWNVMHSLLSSGLVSLVNAPALRTTSISMKEMTDSTCDGLAWGGRWRTVYRAPLNHKSNTLCFISESGNWVNTVDVNTPPLLVTYCKQEYWFNIWFIYILQLCTPHLHGLMYFFIFYYNMPYWGIMLDSLTCKKFLG